MHLRKLHVTNFRALEDIEVEFDGLVNVIVGPNAIGKTTILEAIRLAKAVLSPRTQNETNQTLHKLGIIVPHAPQNINPTALTSRFEAPTTIKCSYSLEQTEIDFIGTILPRIVPNLALQQMGLNFSNPNQAIGFLSSPQGQHAAKQAEALLLETLKAVKSSGFLQLNLAVNYKAATMTGEHPIQQVLYASYDQNLNVAQTIFSYFSADRALPLGEQPIQIGAQDSAQQLESYNSQPEQKYNRLKNTIFNSIINGPQGRKDIEERFAAVFDRILKGRALGDVGVNHHGMLSIPIIDRDTGKSFEIDGLSSGEKGLILTSLIVSGSIAENGLVLLDEPELHLNPAVSRDLLQFFIDEYAEKKNIQFIICTHSAELLTGALDRQNCSLFHLRSGTSIPKIRQHDEGELRDALRRLGSSQSETLLYRGTVSVEGIHDNEILRAGFDQLLSRYLIRVRGGRTNIEADIKELQLASDRGDEIGLHFFLFDHDGRPTNLRDSNFVKFRQLQRHCLENYLIDADIITDLTREKAFSSRPINNVAETTKAMKNLAFEQLDRFVAYNVFKALGLEHVGFSMKFYDLQNPSEMAADLWSQIQVISNKFAELENRNFHEEFQRLFRITREEQTSIWNEKWPERCNGKRLFEAMRANGLVQGDLLKLKKRIMSEMRLKATDNWRSLDSLLRDMLGST